jgi:hypothetical protein
VEMKVIMKVGKVSKIAVSFSFFHNVTLIKGLSIVGKETLVIKKKVDNAITTRNMYLPCRSL